MQLVKSLIKHDHRVNGYVVGCDGKQRFDTHVEASSIAQKMRRRSNTFAHVYLCQHCDRWHIGNTLIPKVARHARN